MGRSKEANVLMRNLETGKEKFMVERIANSKATRAAGWEIVDDAPLKGIKEEVAEKVVNETVPENTDNGEATQDNGTEAPVDATPAAKKKPAGKKKKPVKKP